MNNKDKYKVQSFQVGQTKNGKEMWRIGLQKEGTENTLTGVIWSEDIPRFDGAKFKVGNVVTFLGQDYNSNYNSVVVKNVTVVKEALAGLPKETSDRYLKTIKEFLADVKKRNELGTPKVVLVNTISKLIDDPKFITTPAAERMHHNYLGGLLEHTYEVFEIVSVLTEMYPVEDTDSVRLAAIMHDLGKMYEYETDLKLGTATIDPDFIKNELSHLHWGFRTVHDTGCFNIARMVACHHGRIEWGALFEPETTEEKLVHLADMISAAAGITTIDKLEAMLLNMKTEKETEETKKSEQEQAYACEDNNDVL